MITRVCAQKAQIASEIANWIDGTLVNVLDIEEKHFNYLLYIIRGAGVKRGPTYLPT